MARSVTQCLAGTVWVFLGALISRFRCSEPQAVGEREASPQKWLLTGVAASASETKGSFQVLSSNQMLLGET